ncbi:DUF1145 domain-containing protein [Shewanella inventionis]|uniref:DUF1145 domain-containing protein n=1 Tax=Shewanella inventionis TaxID=1738770 RepID=A0ABQ1IKX7_9GAMM|nr:DUF1145 domain-containing protein [Shewanella inventionis]MCL1156390.1 DUF1145 domain-containing protein [Shewanella inventionis]GGB45167.1 hypothetical protein GCM10011607_01520 [Shewanella inventionis]
MLNKMTLSDIARNDLVLIGKTATLSMWGLFAYGFFVFSQDVTSILTFFAAFTATMHLLLILVVRLSAKGHYQPNINYAAILLWGVFALGELKPQPATS